MARYLTDLIFRPACVYHKVDLIGMKNNGDAFALASLLPSAGDPDSLPLLRFDLDNFFCPKASAADEKSGKTDIDEDWEADKCVMELLWHSGEVREDMLELS